MIFLALRSLFQFGWPKPASSDDIRFAAAYDHVLHQVLADTALDVAKQFTAADALFPHGGDWLSSGLWSRYRSIISPGLGSIVWPARW
jgi:hypothetical protein